MSDVKPPTPAFTFRLFSKTAVNMMTPPADGKGKRRYPAFFKAMSDLIKAKKKDSDTDELELTLERVSVLVEDKLSALQKTKKDLETKIRDTQTQINYSEIPITSPTVYPANFTAEVSKRAMQVLLAYDHISIMLHQLNTTGVITWADRGKYQSAARHEVNSLLDQALKLSTGVLQKHKVQNDIVT